MSGARKRKRKNHNKPDVGTFMAACLLVYPKCSIWRVHDGLAVSYGDPAFDERPQVEALKDAMKHLLGFVPAQRDTMQMRWYHVIPRHKFARKKSRKVFNELQRAPFYEQHRLRMHGQVPQPATPSWYKLPKMRKVALPQPVRDEPNHLVDGLAYYTKSYTIIDESAELKVPQDLKQQMLDEAARRYIKSYEEALRKASLIGKDFGSDPPKV